LVKTNKEATWKKQKLMGG